MKRLLYVSLILTLLMMFAVSGTALAEDPPATEEPAAEAATQAASSDESRSWLKRRIRDYKILALIGAGGMGPSTRRIPNPVRSRNTRHATSRRTQKGIELRTLRGKKGEVWYKAE